VIVSGACRFHVNRLYARQSAPKSRARDSFAENIYCREDLLGMGLRANIGLP
jgi:hypothetical protein